MRKHSPRHREPPRQGGFTNSSRRPTSWSPSKLAQEGAIYGLVECFGIEDRSDGGGIMSLCSKSLIDYVLAHRNDW